MLYTLLLVLSINCISKSHASINLYMVLKLGNSKEVNTINLYQTKIITLKFIEN